MEGKQINRREFLAETLRSATRFLGAISAPEDGPSKVKKPPATQPNFIFILMDDMGWSDLGCYGSTFHETPNIDRLAAQGMRFTNAYAASPVCSPTRAGILTGKYPAHLGITNWIPGRSYPDAELEMPEVCGHLPLEEVTIADALKAAGYVSASIGKWHLGDEPFYPEKHGFDINVGGMDQGFPPSYFYPYDIPTIPIGREGEYLTDRLTSEAVGFIERSKDRPFFLYLSHYALHTPLAAKQEIIAKYEAKADPSAGQHNPIYAAMIESVDEGVGRIMAKLDELKLTDRTVVIFTSDNGGYEKVTSNAPLRSGKGTLYEGGIRVPLITSWPGATRPGSTCDLPFISPDFYPTMLRMTAAEDIPGHSVDGRSFDRVLSHSGTLRRDAVYWHYPHYHSGGATPCGAVRHGDYKLIEYFEDGRLELFNLADDPGESTDLSGEMPDMAERLRSMLADWRDSIGAAMPERRHP